MAKIREKIMHNLEMRQYVLADFGSNTGYSA